MSKYDALGEYLKKQPFGEVPMTFAEIEGVVGDNLPASAYKHRPWWSNNPSNSVMTKVWLEAGYLTERVDMSSKKLVFKRMKPGSTPASTLAGYSGSGMADEGRAFRDEENANDKSGYRHPLIGSMKGTFTLVPPDDNEQPPDDPDSWEALSLAKFDRLLFGKGK
ncbi:MAG TPA: hypothetical protein VHU87_14635 [Rhizomicrobium sp.]|jgi:hypothetical protein|nr:hypothetical protein [Rhizomicrobium sp.]